jgi:hypothetical protein
MTERLKFELKRLFVKYTNNFSCAYGGKIIVFWPHATTPSDYLVMSQDLPRIVKNYYGLVCLVVLTRESYQDVTISLRELYGTNKEAAAEELPGV